MDIGLLLLIVAVTGYIFNLFGQNKQPNHLIGYRTKRSLLNQENWILAQKTFFSMSVLFTFIIVMINKFVGFPLKIYTILSLLSYFLSALITEIRLEKHKRE
ncbi:MAG: SdpI family protein [Streptococcaceae bacterium]|jgi:uncharacterized membrane protein|nr:SdpI family protein [Streptococcaceae bacterium]